MGSPKGKYEVPDITAVNFHESSGEFLWNLEATSFQRNYQFPKKNRLPRYQISQQRDSTVPLQVFFQNRKKRT